MTRSILLAALGAGRALAVVCSNNAEPIALPITDIQVDPSIPGSFMRGISAQIGSPPQNIVVLPWPDLNNTYIYDEEDYCDSTIIWSDKMCSVRRGGLFRDGDSTSFSRTSDLVVAGGASQELGNVRGAEAGVSKLVSTSLAGTEHFATGSATNLTSMPIGIPRLSWDKGYTILHALGLGSNSTFLNSLVQTGQIPSRVWSIFWGRMWTGDEATDLDGSFVLGGYDQEKVVGQNVTLPLDYSEETGCWTGMKVTVSNLLVNFRNGTDHSVMPPNSAVPCCIVPQRQLVWEGPGSIINGFIKAVGMNKTSTSNGLHWNTQHFDVSGSQNIFDGDATFHLTNGLQIRIPNSQLLPPYVAINREGSRVEDNTSRDLLFSIVSGNNPTTLGRYFFTSAYLMVDHDAGTFTMWQGNPTSRSSLVKVDSKPAGDEGCEGDGDGEGVGAAGAGGSTGVSGDEDANTDADADADATTTSSSINVGAIAGGVVGGVVGLAAIAALLLFFLRRRRNRGSTSSSTESTLTPGGYKGRDAPEVYHKANFVHQVVEAPGVEHFPREMHAVTSSLNGTTPVSMDSTLGGTTRSTVTYELDSGGMPQGYG